MIVWLPSEITSHPASGLHLRPRSAAWRALEVIACLCAAVCVCVLHHWWEKDILNTLYYHVLYVPWPDLTKTHRGLCCNDLSFAKRHPGEHCLFIMYTTLSGSMISTIYIIDHPLVHWCLKPALHISCWLLRFWVSQVPVFTMAIRLERTQKEHWTILIDCWCFLSSRSQIFGKPSSTLTLN